MAKTTQSPRFPGIEVSFSGEKFTVPPLPLGMLRNGTLAKLREHDELINDGKFYEAVLIRGEIVLAALRRNYNAALLSDEKFWDFVDIVSIVPAFQAVLGLSGLGGDPDTSGEVKAARTDGTFGEFMPPSLPPTDGN